MYKNPIGNPQNKSINELIQDLNNDKDVEKLILSDCKVGDIYKERVKVMHSLTYL